METLTGVVHRLRLMSIQREKTVLAETLFQLRYQGAV
jgi:2-phospho-L-lactate transferase/gluconeogenesis factor (CofD/UPF0052 family)